MDNMLSAFGGNYNQLSGGSWYTGNSDQDNSSIPILHTSIGTEKNDEVIKDTTNEIITVFTNSNNDQTKVDNDQFNVAAC